MRLAIRQAIDKEGMLELFSGYGTVIGGPVPPSDPWYEDLTGVAPYDPAAAEAAIEAAGAAGTPLTLLYPNIYPTYAAEYVASQLGEVGLDVTVELIEFPAWLERVFTNKDYDMTVVLHVEPRDIGNYANPDYYWNYDSPEVQQLIADAKVALDPAESDELLRQAARLISEESPGRLAPAGRRPHRLHPGRDRLPDQRHRLALRRLGHHPPHLTRSHHPVLNRFQGSDLTPDPQENSPDVVDDGPSP